MFFKIRSLLKTRSGIVRRSYPTEIKCPDLVLRDLNFGTRK